MILEVGWAGRWSRRPPQGVKINGSPYFFKDPASGQSFAQVYDAVAQVLVNKQPVTTQHGLKGDFHAAKEKARLPSFGTALLLNACTGF